MGYLLVVLAIVLVPDVVAQNQSHVSSTTLACPTAVNQVNNRVDQLFSGLLVLSKRVYEMENRFNGLKLMLRNRIDELERACARATVADGLPVSLIINKTTSFSVLVRDCRGYDHSTGGDNVTATLTCVDYPSLVSSQPTVVDNGDGSYQVSLSPECSGNSLVSVSINGKTIKDMPVTVAVIPPYNSLRLKRTITGGVSGSHGIDFAENGDAFIGGWGDNHIHHYDNNGNKINSWRTPGINPHSILVLGNNLIMSLCVPPKVYNYTLSGVLVGSVFTDGCYIDLKLGPDGRLYGSDWGRGRISVFNMKEGSLFHQFTAPQPRGIGFDQNGNLHVTNVHSTLIKVFTPSGVLVTSYVASSFNNNGMFIDKAGNRLFAPDGTQAKVIIKDKDNNLLNKLGLTVQGFTPKNVAVAPNGDVWITADTKIFIYSQ